MVDYAVRVVYNLSQKGGGYMRIQVNVNDEMVKKLDAYAEKMGVSRSALCSVFIGQAVMGYEKSFEVLDKYGEKLIGDEGRR